MMIDPYLSANDILNVLFFSTLFNRRLRAIGSASAKIPQGTVISSDKLEAKFSMHRRILADHKNNKRGLSLEFRMQHSHFGTPLHDRFLLFSGSAEDNEPPKAISIGTSFNYVGKSYHVMGAFENPQSIIDDFKVLWNELEDTSCRVYK